MADESWVLDGLNLNGAALQLEEFSFPPPKKLLEWAKGADASGAILVRDPLVENREGTLKLRVAPRATMLVAAQAVAQVSRKLEECEQNPGGLPLVWTPADGTVPAITFYVLTGAIDDLPMSQTGDSGYFVKAPLLIVSLTCKPFAYGTELVVANVSGGDPILTATIPSVAGDVPAEGRLIVTDSATRDRRTVEWGLEQRFYNPATALLIDSDQLVTSGFGGTGQSGPTGAYDPNATSPASILGTLATVPTAVCGTGTLAHVGTFRVHARVRCLVSGVRVRLSWRDGDGPLSANAFQAPTVLGWNDLDLGIVNISPAAIGTQQWSGQIEAVAQANGVQIAIDYLVLVPCAEGYGRARGPIVPRTGVLTASDQFAASPGALNARSADAGGAWATSGATTDFTVGSGVVSRSTTADASYRQAVIGGNLIDATIAVRLVRTGFGIIRAGLIARWVNSSNYLAMRLDLDQYVETQVDRRMLSARIIQVIAGVETVLAESSIEVAASPFTVTYDLCMTVSGSGAVAGTVRGDRNFDVAATSTAAATGGALASGKSGFLEAVATDGYNNPAPRSYDNFSLLQIPASPPALYAGRSIEFRSSGSALRQDAAGASYGQAPLYRGGRFLVPAAGDKARTSRVLVRADRNDLDAGAYEPLGDGLTVEVRVTPRYMVVGA